MKPTQGSALEMRPEELRKFRRRKRETQGRFWARFGVTQSRGSRFEKGAEIPRPIAILLDLYFNGVVTDGDLGVSLKDAPEAHVAQPAGKPGQPELPDDDFPYTGMGQPTSARRNQLQPMET